MLTTGSTDEKAPYTVAAVTYAVDGRSQNIIYSSVRALRYRKI